MRPAMRGASCAALLVATVLGGCRAARTEQSYRPGRYVQRAPGPDLVEIERRKGRFGYTALGVIPYSHFFGNIEGLSPGVGATIYFPPILPLQVLAVYGATAVVVAPFAILEGALAGGQLPSDGLTAQLAEDVATAFAEEFITPETTRVGQAGVLDEITYGVVSDFSLDAALSVSTHADELYGGQLTYGGLLLGVRLGGSRRYMPRCYVCGGLGWYWFDFENRPDASVPGPYVGFGTEFFTSDGSFALGLEYRANFYFGEDDAGEPVDGGQGQLSALFAWYW